jgi:hypothetical protein
MASVYWQPNPSVDEAHEYPGKLYIAVAGEVTPFTIFSTN